MTMKQLETLTKVQHFTQCGYKKVLKLVDIPKEEWYNTSVKGKVISMKKEKMKIKELKPRDTWIPETWRYNGSGFEKDKKKVIPRKKKYKEKWD